MYLNMREHVLLYRTTVCLRRRVYSFGLLDIHI